MYRPLRKMALVFIVYGLMSAAMAAESVNGKVSSNSAYVKVLQRVSLEISPKGDTDKFLALMVKLTPTFKLGKFPPNDEAYAGLRGYTYGAPYNVHFDTAYQNLLKQLPPAVYQKNLWLANLANLTAYPTQFYQTPIGNFVGLSACKPHNCPTSVRMLFDVKTNQLWGIVHTDDGKNYLLGNPSEEQLVYLILFIGNELILY